MSKILELVSADGSLIQHVKRQTEVLALAAVSQCGLNLQFVKDELWTQRVLKAALHSKPAAIQFIKSPDINMLLKVLGTDGMCLQFIKDPNDLMIHVAVNQNPAAIQFIADPSEDICLIAVLLDASVIQYIKKPTRDVEIFAGKQIA